MSKKLIELTPEEGQAVRERLGVEIESAIVLLRMSERLARAAARQAKDESERDKYLNPMLDFVRENARWFFKDGFMTAEEQEREVSCWQMFLASKNRTLTPSEEKEVDDWLENVDKEMTPSRELLCEKLIERGTPTTQEECEELFMIARLRDWIHGYGENIAA